MRYWPPRTRGREITVSTRSRSSFGSRPIAVSGLIHLVTLGPYEQWRGDLVAISLRGQALQRIRTLDDEVVYVEPISLGHRLRDIAEGEDGSLVLWSDDGTVIRVAASGIERTGRGTVRGVCHLSRRPGGDPCERATTVAEGSTGERSRPCRATPTRTRCSEVSTWILGVGTGGLPTKPRHLRARNVHASIPASVTKTTCRPFSSFSATTTDRDAAQLRRSASTSRPRPAAKALVDAPAASRRSRSWR